MGKLIKINPKPLIFENQLEVRHGDNDFLNISHEQKDELRLQYMEDLMLAMNVISELVNVGQEMRDAGKQTTIGNLTKEQEDAANTIMDLFVYLKDNPKNWIMSKVENVINNLPKI